MFLERENKKSQFRTKDLGLHVIQLPPLSKTKLFYFVDRK